MRLKAVIFDYGLVLSGPADPAARARLLEISGLSPEIFDAHYWKYRLDYDRGTLNGRTYWQTIARETGLTLSAEQIDELIEQDVLLWATVNPLMLDWLERLRAAGLKVGILSNMGEDLLAHMRRNFGWLDLLHHLTWSCELNTVKPEPAIYEHTLTKLGVEPAEALFIDDKMENVEGARSLGIHALLFRDARTLQGDLDRQNWAAGLPPVIPEQHLDG
jgi:putative hydrolase of the HAD superfamily